MHMNNILIDAYAWIEYFEGSEIGKKVKELLEKKYCFTVAITIAETVSKITRNGFDPMPAVDIILGHSTVLPVGEELSIEAGRFHAEQRKKKPQFGLSDAYIYCCAKKIDAKILTNDHHFEDFKEAIMLKP